MKAVKLVFGLICLAILASNIWAMSRWSEARGVYDDICYLRQAHLFQRFGAGGLDTNALRDDDRYFEGKMKEIAFSEWKDPAQWPCHNPMQGGKLVLQYPPGTGFLLALFPEGHQVVPLYIAASLIVCGLALSGIVLARTPWSVVGAGVFGALAVYLMVNPAKASYSVAPTMAVCAVAGFLTAVWLSRDKRSVLMIALIGLLLGASVNFRLPNALLAAGYFLFLGIPFLWTRSLATFVQGLAFGAGVLVGMVPTLAAQAINAGSALATTYGSADVVGPTFDLAVFGQYLRDMQFVLILLAVGATAWLLGARERHKRLAALVVAGNLAFNLGFFMTHPIFTPYYVVPITMLSLWTLSFAGLLQPAATREAASVGCEPASLEALPR
ncbi:hypothetical protein G8O24_28165 [Bradyrhizobium sp. INPA01-394B]|uniref:Glycosyltransferase RgtA/B/C/D-like domain-containing protein n=1 Tax=Bradyrhizobium campsiandrae TaxID=1729892 RepID=A0ABR7UF43_9BRAD|nr:hypothetical protein [Bradyrhizobium campsiandrae]MBC9881211.1 hypothetical protein [Bradyrhizobium campsiandrae]MBC9981808.1 hypothetical protein [Bradyrhizobium campsiandrae]